MGWRQLEILAGRHCCKKQFQPFKTSSALEKPSFRPPSTLVSADQQLTGLSETRLSDICTTFVPTRRGSTYQLPIRPVLQTIWVSDRDRACKFLRWIRYLCQFRAMLGEFDFSDEKLQDTIGVLPPQKADQNHSRKLGGAKSMMYTPFQ